MKKNKLFKNIGMAAAGLIFVSACFFAGCEITKGNELTAESQSIVTESEVVAKDREFIFVCPDQNDQAHWGQVIEGMHIADEELGITTTVIGPEGGDWQAQFPGYMMQAIGKKPDGIIAYCAADGITPYLELARENGVPVLAIDGDATNEKDRVAYIGTDLYDLGADACKAIADVTTGTANVAVICNNFDRDIDLKMLAGFTEASMNYEITIQASRATAGYAETAYQEAAKIFSEYPSVTALFATSDSGVEGVARYIVEHGLNESTVLVAVDDTEENLNYTRSGVIDCLLAKQPKNMGYRGVKLLNLYVENDGVLPKTKYYTDSYKVSAENIDNYKDASNLETAVLKDVVVGYYSSNPDSIFDQQVIDRFQQVGTDGRRTGYAYEYYQAIASVAGWKYYYDLGANGTKKEMVAKLKTGDIDIMCGLTLEEAKLLAAECGVHYDVEPMITYPLTDGTSFYFAVSEKRIDLLVDLKHARKKMKEDSPFFESDLLKKYYVDMGENTLTDSEDLWLGVKKNLTVGYLKKNMPVSDVDKKGNPTGLVQDLIVRLEDYLNTNATISKVTINSKAYATSSELGEALQKSEVDVIFPVYADYWISEKYGFRQTETIFEDRIMILFKGKFDPEKDANMLKKVAGSPRAVGLEEYYQGFYPNAKVTYYNSISAAISAVESGKEKCYVSSASALQRYLNTKTDMKCNTAYLEGSAEFAMSVNENDTVLVGILNKFIDQLPAGSVTSSLMKHSYVETPYSTRDFIRANMLYIVIVLAAFLLVLSAVFVFYGLRVRHFNKMQAKSRQQIEEALEEARGASEAKTRFLSSMSHDIRTPMNAIVGMTAIAEKHVDDSERVLDCLEKINLSSNHLLTLINDVLDISKIESGKVALTPINFSLRDSVTNLVNIARPTVTDKELEFEVHVRGIRYEHVFADEVRVNQIYINLLSNAIKYTPRGGKVIMDVIQEPCEDEEKVRITFIVQDTGIGMSEEFMQTMYETFSRAVDTRIDKIQGTGLGLAIVKQMVNIMGGTIDCESKLDVGTKFTVVLELPIGEEPPERQRLPRVNVLVVDDDTAFLESVSEELDELGVVPVTAESGEEAVGLVKTHDKNEYAVAIVDWKMPGMSGLETIKAIRDIVGKETPVILASAYDWEDIEEKARKVGVNGFISKPLFRSTIYEKLYDALKLDGGSGEIRQDRISDLDGLHVLVAEDNELNWEVISTLLEMYGITCERVENGKLCVEQIYAAPKGKYDLILMDIQMPVMDGRKATRLIRKSKRSYVKEIPIIAMTADAFAEDIAASFASGMNGHVSKPVNMDKLCQEIRKVLKIGEGSKNS